MTNPVAPTLSTAASTSDTAPAQEVAKPAWVAKLEEWHALSAEQRDERTTAAVTTLALELAAPLFDVELSALQRWQELSHQERASVFGVLERLHQYTDDAAANAYDAAHELLSAFAPPEEP